MIDTGNVQSLSKGNKLENAELEMMRLKKSQKIIVDEVL